MKAVSNTKLRTKIRNLTVIFPTYNEAEGIASILHELFTLLRGIPCIVVDDCSPDGTKRVVQNLQKTYPSLTCVSPKEHLGLAKSLELGIAHATTEYVVWLDADGSHPIANIPNMYAMRNNHTLIVSSSRLQKKLDSRPLSIRWYSEGINMLCQLFLGPSITEYTSGFVLAPKKIISELTLRGDYGEYCIDLLTRAKRHGYDVHEIPMRVINRKVGTSKTNASLLQFLQHGLRYLWTIAQLASKDT